MRTITGHMIVKNEECWVWYSIMSVIDYLDKLIIFDNGSTDSTVEIISTISNNPKYSDKIIFEEKGSTDKKGYTKLRQEQLDRTDSDYFMVIDGDEIWWKNSIEEIIKIINQNNPPMLIATRFINCAGDIFHYRDDKRESYCINGIKGAITIRVYSANIEGIHLDGDYGVEGYVDKSNHTVQNHIWETVIQEGKYLHTSFLQRSSSVKKDIEVLRRGRKLLFQNLWDYSFEKNFKYPEVLYYQTPKIVPSPWNKAGAIRYFCQVFKMKRLLKNICKHI